MGNAEDGETDGRHEGTEGKSHESFNTNKAVR